MNAKQRNLSVFFSVACVIGFIVCVIAFVIGLMFAYCRYEFFVAEVNKSKNTALYIVR
jgi:type IV secretory pathway component VirB8